MITRTDLDAWVDYLEATPEVATIPTAVVTRLNAVRFDLPIELLHVEHVAAEAVSA